LKFDYNWCLKNGYPSKEVERHNLKVFGSFVCGGGSTMGYKLAGYDHLGGVEIDKKLSEVYKINHKPKYYYNEDIREFNKRTDLPNELYNLDIFDGSPPCSTFSISGSREKNWGKLRKFNEGQAKQILDDLFFHWIDTVDKLKPKVAIAENVKGLIQGNAKGYVVEIKKRLNEIGYNVQLFLLNAASMGVPQKRERVFFICHRKELSYPKLELKFNEKLIVYGEIRDDDMQNRITKEKKKLWDNRKFTDIGIESIQARLYNKPNNDFNMKFLKNNKVSNTITAHDKCVDYQLPRYRSDKELIKAGSFPVDYNFLKNKVKYIVGMSVPPIMTAQISYEVYKQWFK